MESNARKSLGSILIIVIAIVIIFTIYLFIKDSYNTPSKVNIQGTVIATGNNVTVTDLVFTNNNSTYSATLIGKNPQSYFVTLYNPDTYNITAKWKSNEYSWQSGEKNVGKLPLNITGYFVSSHITQNFIVPTPYSDIRINGKVSTSFTTTPTEIIFAMQSPEVKSYSENFSEGSYSISLPNDAQYKVNVSFRDIFNTTKSCSPTQNNPFSLNEADNISNNTENWNC